MNVIVRLTQSPGRHMGFLFIGNGAALVFVMQVHIKVLNLYEFLKFRIVIQKIEINLFDFCSKIVMDIDICTALGII